MACPPERGDNPRAVASGLSYLQVDKHGILILYHLNQYRPCIPQDFRAKVGKGGIISVRITTLSKLQKTFCLKIYKDLENILPQRLKPPLGFTKPCSKINFHWGLFDFPIGDFPHCSYYPMGFMWKKLMFTLC